MGNQLELVCLGAAVEQREEPALGAGPCGRPPPCSDQRNLGRPVDESEHVDTQWCQAKALGNRIDLTFSGWIIAVR
jgi:hypothetical protein